MRAVILVVLLYVLVVNLAALFWIISVCLRAPFSLGPKQYLSILKGV